MLSRSTSGRVSSPSTPKSLRRRWFVDYKLQGTIVARVVLYWLGCQFMTAVLLFGFKAVMGQVDIADDMSMFYRCALFGTLGFLPLAVIDMVRLSHRFAGPMLRFRRAMHELGRGEHVEPLRFRDGDFWQDLATDFNAVLNRVQDQRENRETDRALAADPDADLEAVGSGSM
jgi:hypothetical protein